LGFPSFAKLLGRRRPVIGVVHLLPLPGSPLHGGDMEEVVRRAVADAEALESGGVDAIIVENYGDVPYYPSRVPPITVASMAYVVSKVVERVGVPVGVNVLRNDGVAALSIAHAVGAKFIRVNVLTEAAVTDQGIVEGCAHELMRLRRYLSSDVAVLADVHVKHAYPLMRRSPAESARDVVSRGLADALVVTGRRTGEPPRRDAVELVKGAAPEVPVLVGSGVDCYNVDQYFEVCDGFIVGTYFKRGGRTAAPVDPERVRRLVERVEVLRAGV